MTHILVKYSLWKRRNSFSKMVEAEAANGND
jgi:hypothetical protein